MKACNLNEPSHKSIIIISVVCLILTFTSVSAEDSFLTPHSPLYQGGVKGGYLLDGLHKFNSGDDPSWASPEFDDSQWKRVNIPQGLQSQGISPVKGIGWYRIHFIPSDEIRNIQPAAALGRIGNMDVVFVNGVKIGGEGMMGKRFVEAAKTERVYRIPDGLLKINDTNVLSVRVMNVYKEGGIFEGNLILGDYRDLLIDKLKRGQSRKNLEVIFLAITGIFFLFCLFLYIRGLREKEYIYFLVFTLVWGILYFLDSLTFYETGLKTPLIQQVIYTLSCLFPLIIFIFFISVYGENYNLTMRSFAIYSLVLSFMFLFFSTYSYSLDYLLYMLWIIEILLLCSAAMYFTVRAYMKGLPESIPVLIGMAVLTAAVIIEALSGLNIKFAVGLKINEYLVTIFMICMMYGLIMRIVRFNEGVRALSGRILTAQEEERKRLSMELHDGLGQNLLTVKFNLQRVNQKLENPLIDGIIEDVSGSINELRDISQGLIPLRLEDMGIGYTLTLYAEKFSEKTGIKVDITADLNYRPSQLIEINLFRIFQEILSNIAKHSEAGNVRAVIKSIESGIIMEIKDDGKGFDYTKELYGRRGIGLSTISERVNLLRGSLTVKSREGEGAFIRIEAPR